MGGIVRAAVVAAALAVWAVPAHAQLASHPSGEGGRQLRRGIYLGLGGAVGAHLATNTDAAFGYGGQAKLGYSVNRGLQIYLAGAVHTASLSTGVAGSTAAQRAILATAHLHHFIYQDRSGLGVFYDAAVGLGFADPVVPGSSGSGIGLGYSGGLGIEIPLTPYVSIVPEAFYRSLTPSVQGASTRIDLIGLQIGIVYY